MLQPGWLPYREATLWQRAWHGTLLEDKVGAGGLMYRRNRYYDSKSGRFTQEDPIGLAGGLNLYGFAAGDPANYGDPFGLFPDTVQVACRAVDNTSAFTHCAVRVTDDSAGTATIYELLATGLGERQTAGIEADPEQIARYAGRWIDVDVPSGQTPKEFAARVRGSAEQVAGRVNGLRYSPLGGANSNHFVYQIITGAGGKVPLRATIPGRTAPGLCGGRGIFQGLNCKLY